MFNKEKKNKSNKMNQNINKSKSTCDSISWKL